MRRKGLERRKHLFDGCVGHVGYRLALVQSLYEVVLGLGFQLFMYHRRGIGHEARAPTLHRRCSIFFTRHSLALFPVPMQIIILVVWFQCI
jgi:hypothetical protein